MLLSLIARQVWVKNVVGRIIGSLLHSLCEGTAFILGLNLTLWQLVYMFQTESSSFVYLGCWNLVYIPIIGAIIIVDY